MADKEEKMGALKKIVILHGWTYSLDKWTGFVSSLTESGFEVYLPKIPGLTEESSEVWDLNKYTNWLKKLLDKYQNKIILLGHSNGGRIAINFAAKYPNKLEKLILIDSAGIFHNEIPIRLKRIIFNNFSKVGSKFTKSNFVRKILYKFAREGDYEKASKNMQKTITNLISIDLKPELSEVKTPTLIIWGENDKTTSIKDAYLMNKLIKRSKLKVIGGARHSPFFTNPEEVIKIIKNDI